MLACLNCSLLLVFAVSGLLLSKEQNWEDNIGLVEKVNHTSLIAGILQATGQVFYSFLGFDAVCLLSQEAKRAEKMVRKRIEMHIVGGDYQN
jgi:amino acid transporter